jgi:hypothetical protein
MSMMTSAVLDGAMVTGLVDVRMVSLGYTGGEDGIGGWVRSQPSRSLKSQKFGGWPMTTVFRDSEAPCETFPGVARGLAGNVIVRLVSRANCEGRVVRLGSFKRLK